MTEIKKQLSNIKKGQATIDTLLKEGKVAFKGGPCEAGEWKLETFYNKGDCTVGFATTGNQIDAEFPVHCHANSKEYLIVAQGSVLLTMDGMAMRIMKEGDCASIPQGCAHSTKPIVMPVKLVYVCIPYDPELGEGKGSAVCPQKT